MSGTAGRRLFNHSGTALVVRGVLAVALAFLLASFPRFAVAALAYVFGCYALADGLANLAHYFYDPARHSRWSLAAVVVSIGAGLVAISWPGITTAALAVLLGIWGLALGVSQLFLALEDRGTVRVWRSPALTGLAFVGFGVMALGSSGAGIAGLAGLLAAFSAVAGLLLIISGISMRRISSRTTTV